MGKKYIINGKLNRDLINETGAPSKYGLDTIDKLIEGFIQTGESLKPNL